jgi:hypothetical protein
MIAYRFKPVFEQVIDHSAYRVSLRAEKNLYAHLPKAHKRPHADAAHDESIRAGLMKQVDRRLAAALLVWWIGDQVYIDDFSILDFNHGKHVAVPEVSRSERIEASRVQRRHGYLSSHVFYLLFFPSWR